jgi:5'-3' exonuclease
MGIKDFYKHLRAKYPECFTPVHYSAFKYKKVAIDMMNILYIFKARNDRDWMKYIVEYLLKLRRYCVHPICVFDGQSHTLKQSTVEKRRSDREKGRNRVENYKEALEHYKTTKEINDTLQQFLSNKPHLISQLTQLPLIGQIEDHLERQNKQYSIHFRSTEVQAIKDIIQALGICVLTAEFDGEALCAYLSAQDCVEAVISNDSDVFFFGCKRVIFRGMDEGGYLVERDTILEKLGIDWEKFRDLCLLCGTDFNTPIKGIGFCKAYALILKYDTVKNENIPFYEQLDQQLFQEIKDMCSPTSEHLETLDVHYSKPIDWNKLQLLFFQQQIYMSPEQLHIQLNYPEIYDLIE